MPWWTSSYIHLGTCVYFSFHVHCLIQLLRDHSESSLCPIFWPFLTYFVSYSLVFGDSAIRDHTFFLRHRPRFFSPPAFTSADNVDTYLAEKKPCFILQSHLFNLQAFFKIKYPQLGESGCCMRFRLLIKFKLNASSRPEVKVHRHKKQCQFFLPVNGKSAFLHLAGLFLVSTSTHFFSNYAYFSTPAQVLHKVTS